MESRETQVEQAKRNLAVLWADGNEELEEAYYMGFNEMEAEATPKPTVTTPAIKPGWPTIARGEKVVFKDHWCTVVAMTANGVELNIGEPTAALRKRAAQNAAAQRHAELKSNRKKKSVRKKQHANRKR